MGDLSFSFDFCRDCQKAAREVPAAVEQSQAALKEVLGHLEVRPACVCDSLPGSML